MNNEEYIARAEAIRQKRNEDLKSLAYQYIKENAAFKAGDIITDGHTIILVQRIALYSYTQTPKYMYRGPVLTKQLKPRKDGSDGSVFPDRATMVVPAGQKY